MTSDSSLADLFAHAGPGDRRRGRSRPEDRFSILNAGTDDLLRVLRDPRLDPLPSRIAYASMPRQYGVEDTRNYMTFHLQRAGCGQPALGRAVKRLFATSHGRPRAINQIT